MNIVFPNLNNLTMDVPSGTSIDGACTLAGHPIDRPCGGKGSCGKCKIVVEDEAGRRTVLACQAAVSEGMRIFLRPDIGAHRILQSEHTWKPEKLRKHNCRYGAACDLGTTSVVLALFDLGDGRLLAKKSMLNTQTAIAADVIGRLDAALKPGGAQLLQGKAVETICILLNAVCIEAGIAGEQIGVLTLAGNSAMIHLLMAWPVETLATAPYECYQTEAVTCPASQIGLNFGGVLEILPLIGSFVGADTTAAALAASMGEGDGIKLLIDLGTNGELVLGGAEKLLAASAAAGPAMEGAGISCGMRGTSGAIERVALKNGMPKAAVIGGGEAVGICGSGLIDLAAELVRCNIATPQGRLAQDFEVAPAVSFTPEDLRSLQLSKGAVAAAASLLIRSFGIEPKDIDEILLAGAFGNYIDLSSAQAIGLIPDFAGVPVHAIGNASMLGAQMYLLDEAKRIAALSLAGQAQHLDMASSPDFAMTYAMHMSLLPMTDLEDDW